jgi:hypothetical protein
MVRNSERNGDSDGHADDGRAGEGSPNSRRAVSSPGDGSVAARWAAAKLVEATWGEVRCVAVRSPAAWWRVPS